MEPDYYKNNEKYEEEVLSEGMIANAKLLSNDKYEFDNIMMLFGDRLKIIPNGSSNISRKIKSKCLNDRYIYRILNWHMSHTGLKNDFRESIFELSNVTTSLFSHYTNERDYIGLEQIVHSNEGYYAIGSGLNYMINSLYTLMASYTKYIGEFATPNDLIYKDIRTNMKNEPSLSDIDLKTFNLVRLLVVVSDNLPNTNYNKVILNKKSPINSRAYNHGGDYVVLNDLLYAGKYGKAAMQYSKIFNSYVGYPKAYDELLESYDYVLYMTRLGNVIDKDVIKKILKTIYLYYGAKYLRMQENNAMDKKGLETYKQKVMNAFSSVMNQYDIDLNNDDLRYKQCCEKIIEFDLNFNKEYYKLTKTKESFEPHEKVPMDTSEKIRKLKLKHNLEN